MSANSKNITYPYQVDRRGRTSTAEREDHIRQLVEQVLFTSPGERVNRPEFGSGLRQLVFAPNSDLLAQTSEVTTQAALQQWLGDRITVSEVDVEREEATIKVTVRYLINETQEEVVESFER